MDNTKAKGGSKMEEKNLQGKASETTVSAGKVGKSVTVSKKEKVNVVKNEEVKEQPIFRKVVTRQEGGKKKKKKEETVFTQLVKALLIVVILLIIMYLIFFIRNTIIFNDIVAKMERFTDFNNYSYESISRVNGSNDVTTIKCSKKDSVTLAEFMKNEESLIIFWTDTQNQEKVVLYPESNRAEISNNTDGVVVAMPLMSELEQGTVRAFLSLGTLIYSETYNGRDCYVIELDKEQKVWVDKETGLVLRREYTNNYIEYINIQLNNNGEIAKPDLTGYVVTQ